MTTSPFEFAFTAAYRLAAAPFGVTPSRALVTVDDAERLLVARYGPWEVRTSLSNITGVHITGPYRAVFTIGPAHLSFSDRGLTMASNPHQGVCMTFADPVGGIEPSGRIRHPGLTVTVADCAGLAELLRGSTASA